VAKRYECFECGHWAEPYHIVACDVNENELWFCGWKCFATWLMKKVEGYEFRWSELVAFQNGLGIMMKKGTLFTLPRVQ